LICAIDLQRTGLLEAAGGADSSTGTEPRGRAIVLAPALERSHWALLKEVIQLFNVPGVALGPDFKAEAPQFGGIVWL
jgi:hypothetical protein